MFEVEIDQNDRPTLVRVINQTAQNACGTVTQSPLRPNGGRTYSGTFGPGTTTIAIPTNVGGRLQYFYDPVRDRYDGIDIDLRWPC